MPEKEVLITGIGLITALGIGRTENWEQLCAGQSGIRAIQNFDVSDYQTRFGGEIPRTFDDFFAERFSKRTQKQTALFSKLCLASTALALDDGQMTLEQEDATTVGLCIGTGVGGLSYWEQALLDGVTRAFGEQSLSFKEEHYTQLVQNVESIAVLKYMANAAAAMTSLSFGIEGPSLTFSNACSSGAYAIGCAHDMIKLGRADIMIAGGVDASISRSVLSAFNNLQAISEWNDHPHQASRPFDKKRHGFVLSDGAGMVILESAEHCQKRGGRPYAKICGHAMTSEAHHLVQPAEGGHKMAQTMQRALQDAALAPEQIDYISAHGTSTVLNDKYETAAIKEVFGAHAYRLAISAQKSMIGHTIGAAGAIELAVTALTIANDRISPTINYEFPDEDCDLNYTPNVAQDRVVQAALSNSFAFGGHNSTIVIAKP